MEIARRWLDTFTERRASGDTRDGAPPVDLTAQAPATFGPFAQFYVAERADAGSTAVKRLKWIEGVVLARAVEHFGSKTKLRTIGVIEVERWVTKLRKTKKRRQAGTLDEQAVLNHVRAIGNLFKRAIKHRVAAFNPADVTLFDQQYKPDPDPVEPQWWQPATAALLLETARRRAEVEASPHARTFYPLFATLLLTGARPSEILGDERNHGLQIGDVTLRGGPFGHGIIFIRPHPRTSGGTRRRRLKTKKATRRVPIVPQLAPIREEWLTRQHGDADPTALVFPGGLAFQKRGRRDPREELRDVAEDAGLTVRLDGCAPERCKTYDARHTYTTQAIHSLDQDGQGVTLFDLMHLTGHTSTELIQTRYGHDGWIGVPTRGVSFQVANYQGDLKDRLAGLDDRIEAAKATRNKHRAPEHRTVSHRQPTPAPKHRPRVKGASTI